MVKRLSDDLFGAYAMFLALVAGVLAALAGVTVDLSAPAVETYVLPIFFAQVGYELRTEFTDGHFKKKINLLSPALAAVLGVAVPAVLYLLVAGPQGWAVPTATDITLGLAAIVFFGSKLGLRARFLALASIDDILGLVVLLVVFSGKISIGNLLIALVCLFLFGFGQRQSSRISVPFSLFAILCLVFAGSSGIQTSIFGFAFGALLRDSRFEVGLKSFNNLITLPLFGFVVMAHNLSGDLKSISIGVFIAVCLRPVGKLIGIYLGGTIGDILSSKRTDHKSWLLIGLLGGIGLTVSFLLASLSFGSEAEISAAILGTLAASAVSILTFAVTANRLKHRVAK